MIISIADSHAPDVLATLFDGHRCSGPLCRQVIRVAQPYGLDEVRRIGRGKDFAHAVAVCVLAFLVGIAAAIVEQIEREPQDLERGRGLPALGKDFRLDAVAGLIDGREMLPGRGCQADEIKQREVVAVLRAMFYLGKEKVAVCGIFEHEFHDDAPFSTQE